MSTLDVREDERWSAGNPDDLLWVELDGDHAVYHRPSGKTHFFNEASRSLLSDFLSSPRRAEEIAEWLGLDGTSPADLRELDDFLCRFEELGFLARS